MRILKTTPILLCDRIEPHLPFYTGPLGYELRASVPHGDVLGFVILARDSVEMMMQTLDSVAADVPSMAQTAGATAFYHEVDDLDEVRRRLGDTPLLCGPRVTPYGMREIFVRDSAGHTHGFAQPVAAG